MAERVFNVLFLCTGNSARSILAEIILRKDGAGRFNAFLREAIPRGRQPVRSQGARGVRLSERRVSLEELGRICGARRAGNGFRVHRL